MFDIDKMFLARYNYTVKNGKIRKVDYNAVDAMRNPQNQTTALLQNLLLDIYQGVLKNDENFLATNTPLDVSTGPLKKFAEEIVLKNDKSVQDMWYLNPIFHSEQRTKNSGSDGGIGPMALNSVFRYFIQTSGLKLRDNKYLEALALNNLNKVFDVNGEDILDLTSALINAHVDAVKDNYIGGMNVNGYTFDITSFLVTSGFGYSTFTLLSQPIIKQMAEIYNDGQNSIINKEDKDSVNKQIRLLLESYGGTTELATVGELSDEYMKTQLKEEGTEQWNEQQRRYANTFLYLKRVAEAYRLAINVAQIDTKKFGKNSDELITFKQLVDLFMTYNTVFENPEALYKNTFLGQKYEDAVNGAFDMFGNAVIEFSPIYLNAVTEIMNRYGKTGYFGKKFLKALGPSVKQVLVLPFFNEYLKNRFNDKDETPILRRLVTGKDSVTSRYHNIVQKAYARNEGIALFKAMKYNTSLKNEKIAQFFNLSQSLNDNEILKSEVSSALYELASSNDKDIRLWANDFIVYMYYVAGGLDANAGGRSRTTIFDIVPPQALGNINTKPDGTGITYNDYIQLNIFSKDKKELSESELKQAIMLTALIDESGAIPDVTRKRAGQNQFGITALIPDSQKIIRIGFGSNKLFSANTNKFAPYIKRNVVNSSGAAFTNLYELVGVDFIKGKGGKVFANPIYKQILTLGYKSPFRGNYAVKGDGYITSDGKIYSLLNDKVDEKNVDIKDMKKVLSATSGEYLFLYRATIQEFDKHGKEISDYDLTPSEYGAILKADTVYYINYGNPSASDDISDDLVAYARYLHKNLIIVNPEDENIKVDDVGSTFTIISPSDFGEITQAYLYPGNKTILSDTENKIISANEGKTFLSPIGFAAKAESEKEKGEDIKKQCKS